MGEDRFEPSILTHSVDVSDQKLLSDVSRQLATSMLEPGRAQAPDGEAHLSPLGLLVSPNGTFNVEFLDNHWWTQLAMGTVTALAAVLLAGFCWIVANLVRSAREGSPFTRRNARRLGILGALAALGPSLWKITDHVVNTQLLADTSAAGRFVPVVEWWQVPNYTTIAIGLVLLTLAASWRRGVELEKDVEGLV